MIALKEFELPDVGEGVAEGEFVTWHVTPGDEVTGDQMLVEVGIDKVLVDVPSPFDGMVKGLLAEEGKVVPVGGIIITIQEDGDDEKAAETTDTDAEAAGFESVEGDDGVSNDESDSGGRVFTPPSVRRLTYELGADLDAVDDSGSSSRVIKGDVRAVANGDGDEDDEPSGPRAVRTSRESATVKRDEGMSASTSPSTPTESADREQTLAASTTCALVREGNADIDAVPAMEACDGEVFVSPEVVQGYARAQRETQAMDAEAVPAEADAGTVAAEATVDATSEPVPPKTGPGAGERVPYRGIRKAIGDQMQRSKYTTPYVTHHDEVDVTELVELRGQLKSAAEERDSWLTYMPFVMKTVVVALEGFPCLNSQLDEENEEVVLRNGYNIGVTVATDTGPLVPVIHDADRKGMLEFADEMNERAEKAHNRKIAPEEMRGGILTITNVGGIGDEHTTPIINYPEVAILTLGAVKEKPRIVDGEIVPRNVFTPSLSFDHRVVDGAQGARFTNRVKELLEDPRLLVLE